MRPTHLKIFVQILLCTCLLSSCVPEPEREKSQGVQLILSTDNFEATTTFEVRFEEPMVKGDAVGQAVKQSPLVIMPDIPGEFSWLSQRSGIFSPSAPPAMDQTYQFRLRPGLRALDGKPLQAILQRKLSTPPLAIVQCHGGWLDSANAPTRPKFTVIFNADVEVKKAEALAQFRSEAGKVVAAQAEYGTSMNVGSQTSDLAWHRAFLAGKATAPGTLVADNRVLTVSNCVIFTPATPLPVGKGWRLVLARSLPAVGERARLAGPMEQFIGEVLPFKVVDVQPQNTLHGGKSVQITFTRPLLPSLTATNIAEWFSFAPTVPYECEVSGRTLTLRGEFEKRGRLAIRAGFPGTEGLSMEERVEEEIQFSAISPGLFLPAFDAAQLSHGSRRMDLLAVNAGEFQVRVKWLDRHALIHALRGYRHHRERPFASRAPKVSAYSRSSPWVQTQQEIEYELVPGRTIFQTNLTMSAGEDAPERFEFHWNTLLGGRTNGAVFLAADTTQQRESGAIGVGAQALIQLTDLGLGWKRWETNALVWVFSHASGQPVAGAKISVLTDEDENVFECVADTNGLAWVKFTPESRWLLAEKDGDLHAVQWNESPDQIPLWSFGLPLEWRTTAAWAPQLFVFTDRLTYRPGDTVHLKAIVRSEIAGTLRRPEAETVMCRVSDARGRNILETNLTLSPQGSAATDLVLPDSGLGQFVARFEMDEGSAYHAFQVQQFRPSAFELSMTMPAASTDEPALDITLSGRYYMGKALGKANVNWTIEASPVPFMHAAWADYVFCSQIDGGLASSLGRRTTAVTVQGKGQLSRDGALQLTPSLGSNLSVVQPQAIAVHAEVTDLNQQTISRDATFTRHSSEFYLGVKLPRKVWPTGTPQPVELIAVRNDGASYTGVTSVACTVTKLDWINTRYQGAGGQPRYQARLETNLVSQKQLILDGQTSTNRASPAKPITELVLDEPGQYLVEFAAADSQARAVRTSVLVYAGSANEDLEWDFKNGDAIELVCDKARYEPGDIARVLVKSPIAGTALVTVERGVVLRSFLHELTGNASVVEIPVLTNDAPNIYVSLLQIRGGAESQQEFPSPEFRLGICALEVVDPASELDVHLAAGQDDYRPGEMIEIDGVVTVQGRPVSGAEVTLFAVDDGVLSLSAYRTPDPHEFFYKQRPLAVASGISLQHLLGEDPNKQVFENKGYVVGGGGKMEGRVRKNFQACAFWQSDLLTDEAGRFKTRFQAPDSLTRYRVMAVAHAAGHKFGSGAFPVEVNKPLMLEPSLPQFAHVGDLLVARAVVHNRTSERAPVQVRAQLDALAAGALLSRTLDIAAGGSAVFEFPVKFLGVGTSKWTWHAQYDPQLTGETTAVKPVAFQPGKVLRGKDSMRDAVETTVSVDYVTPRLREILYVTADVSETNLLAQANPQLLEGEGEVIVRVSNTRAVDLLEAVDQLLHYPYGCVEQTSSSLLPWLVLQDLQEVLPSQRSEKEVAKAVRAGVDRLLSMQTASGGLAYWPGQRDAMLWGSAYGGMTLAMAARQGVDMPEGSLEKLFDYLSRELRRSGGARGGDASALCLVLYALSLAERAEPAYVEQLFQGRGALTFEDRCLLALATPNQQETPLLELLQKSVTNRVADAAGFGSASREVAIELLAWTHFRPHSPEVEKRVDKLLGSRASGHWVTTQGNAWSLMALAEYIRSRGGNAQPRQVTVAWHGKQHAIELGGKPLVTTHRWPLETSLDRRPLKLLNPNRAPCYVQVEVSCRPKVTHQPRQNHGFSLQRTYTLLDEDGQAATNQLMRVGDSVLVTLQLQTSRAAHYVAIDDPLPALFEAINPEYKDQQSRHSRQLQTPWYSSYAELRADRAVFFRDYLEPGAHTIRYLARVRAAGETTAPSAKVEEMYHPDVFGLSGSAVVRSLPLN